MLREACVSTPIHLEEMERRVLLSTVTALPQHVKHPKGRRLAALAAPLHRKHGHKATIAAVVAPAARRASHHHHHHAHAPLSLTAGPIVLATPATVSPAPLNVNRTGSSPSSSSTPATSTTGTAVAGSWPQGQTYVGATGPVASPGNAGSTSGTAGHTTPTGSSSSSGTTSTTSSGSSPTGPSGSAAPAITFPNVLVNDPSLDATTNDTQSETSTIAFGNTVLTAYNDSGSHAVNATKFTGWSRSTDGGQTFTDMGVLPTNTNGDAGDPVLARDNVSGAVYLATLSMGSKAVIQVFKSTDGGATFGAPVNACPGFTGGNLDKEWIAVDNATGAGQGNVYLIVRDFGTNNGIRLTRSTDGGATWGPSNGVAIASGTVQGAWVTVGPDHSVYAFWLDGSTSQHIYMRKSTDGGQTFGATVTVATLTTTGSNGDFGLGFRTDAFPQAVVNPANPNLLYLAYPDKGTGGDRGNIYFVQSSDGGATWGAPVKVNDDATLNDQWQPALAIKPNGSQLFIGWYDRRNDAANALIDTYGTIGTIAGNAVTFQPNFKITTTSFPSLYGVDPAINSVYMGDYDSASADNGYFYYSWADNRDASTARTGKQANVRLAAISTDLQVAASTPAAGAIVSAAPTDFSLTLSDAYDASTVQASDLTVNGVAADAVTQTSATALTFHYNKSPVTAQGAQTMAIAAGAIARASDGGPIDAFTSTFRYDLSPMTVTGTTPASGSQVTLPLASIDVHFSEPYGAASIAANNLTLSQGTVTGFTLVDPQTVRYALSGITSETTVTFNLAAGAVTDAYGNPGQAFTGSFTTDLGTVPFPTPLASRAPQGSMVYGGTTSALIGAAGDTDAFTINLDAGQTFTVTATGAATLQPTLTVLNPSGAVVGTASATTAGQPTLIQTVPVTTAGTYTVVVGGVGSTVGTYTVGVTLNAAQQAGNYGGAPNHTLSSAQDINGSFLSLGGGATRGAVVGGPGASTQLFSTDFESGLGGFTVANTIGGLWHLSTGRGSQTGHSATQSLYFGQGEGPNGGGTYNTGTRVAGTVTSPAIALPAASNVTLDFNYVLQTEGGSTYDQALVQVSTDGGTTFTTLTNLSASGQSSAWKAAPTVSLASYAGKTVVLRFSFDTIDSAANTYEGWYVDDVRVQVTSALQDYYAFNLAAGDRVSLALKAATAGSDDVKLADANGNVLASSAGSPANVDKVIADFAAPATGTYYAYVTSPTGAGTAYALVVTRNADFDTEANDTVATAQSLVATRVLGNIGGTATGPVALASLTGQSVDGAQVDGVRLSFAVGDAPSTDAVVEDNADNPGLGDAVIRGDATGVLTLDFDRPTASLSFDLGFAPGEDAGGGGSGNGDDDATPTGYVQLFDADGNLIENYSLGTDDQAHSAFTDGHFTYDGPAPVARAVIHMNQADGDFALGNLAVSSGNTVDTYKFTLAAGVSLNALTSTPGDGPGEYVNAFDPRLRLLDANGNQIALDDNSAPDGRNARLSYVAPATGTYYLEVSSSTAASTYGDYVLSLGDGLTFTAPANVKEGDGTVTATLTASSAPTSDVTVTLASGDPSRLTVPSTVTLKAGQTTVAVPLTVVDDNLLNGPQLVSITASAGGYFPASAVVNVHDDETATLSVTLPATAKEGDGSVTGTITASAAPTRDLVVQLASNNTSKLSVPATVTLKAGQTTATFTATVVDNTVIDGTLAATVTASQENWTTGTGTVSVADNDATITVTLPASGWEGQALTNAGTVKIGGTLTTALVVNLVSSDPSSLTVPATVTIPAGQTSVTFTPTLPADTVKQGAARSASVTASANGLPSAIGSLLVHDATFDHLAVDAITGPKTAGIAFVAAAHAYNAGNEVIATYAGTGTVAATGQAGGALPLTPTSITFAAGNWGGNETITAVDPAAKLTVTSGGASASSNAFAVVPGSPATFAWGAIPTPQVANVPFPVTLTAKDANGFTATGFNGTVNLTAVATLPASQTMLGSPSYYSTSSSGTYTLGYAFTPNTSFQVTHVRSYFGTKVSIWTSTGTLVTSQAVSGTAGTWTDTPLVTPVTLQAGVTYRVGVYTGTTAHYWLSGTPVSPFFATLGSCYELGGDGFPTTTDSGLFWMVDLRGNVATPTNVPVTPTTATFTNGVWTGNVSVAQGATALHLHADDGATHTGDSAAFDVIQRTLALTLPSDVRENDGSATGLLNVSPAPTSDLVVSLTSSDANRLGVPATVTVPAGQTSVAVPLTIINNASLDGLESVTVTATAPGGYANGVAAVKVHDDETASLALVVPAAVAEGSGTFTGTITASAAPVADVTVNLTATGSAGRVNVPATVTLKAGQATATFTAAVVDNAVIDGTGLVTIGANADNWTGDFRSVTVSDNDATLAVALPASAWEGQTGLTGTVTIGGTLTAPLTVNLASTDAVALGVPAQVTIPAGATSATFPLTVPGDAVKQGAPRTETVTASATGLPTQAGTLQLHDATLDHLGLDPIAGPVAAGASIPVKAYAYNAANEPIATYAVTAALTAAGQNGAQAVFPASVTFAAGVWSGTVGLDVADPAVKLTATSGGLSAVSNAFKVNAGAAASFTWGAVSTPHVINTPFAATLTAKDAYGNVATGFNGTVNLSGQVGITSSQTLLGSPTYTQTNTGTYTLGYAFTPTSAMTVTGVRSYFGTKVSIWTSAGTLVVSQTVSGTPAAWTETPLATPVTLQANTTYVIGVYTNGGTYYFQNVQAPNPSFATIGASYYGSADAMPTTPDSGAVEWFVDLRANVGGVATTTVPVTPATATFTNGTWTGQVTVTQAAAGMHLHADDGANHTGDSATFDAIDPAAPPPAPVLSASSDSGASSTDRLTNFNNASAAKALQFTVAGTASGATVTLYADGVAIGSATATGAVTTVTTDGQTTLADGAHAITARVTFPGYAQTADSAPTTVTIDTTPPAAPPPPKLQAASDTGASNADGVTNAKSQTFDLTASEAGTLHLDYDGKTGPTVSVGAAGTVPLALLTAASGYHPAVNYAAGSSPHYLATADFDGDGRADVACVNQTGGSISVFHANADGSLTLAKTLTTTGGTLYAIQAVDLNKDGKPDLVVYNSSTIQAFTNTGGGSFGAAVSTPTGATGGAYDVVGDFNNDGFPDVAVSASGGDAVAVLLNDGKGALLTGKATSTATPAYNVGAGDFNNDGKLDLVVSSGASTLLVLIGKGDGTFTTGASLATAGSSTLGIAVADVNGDGKLDVMSGDQNSGLISTFLGKGDGTFATASATTLPYPCNQILAADLNGDGKVDVAGTSVNYALLVLAYGNGNGTFALASPSTYSVGNTPWSLAAGDVNGDGVPDLITANSGANNISVLLANSTGLTEGTHTLDAYLTDLAGNTSPVSAPATVTVDFTPPTATLAGAPPVSAAGGTTYTFTVTYADALSGVDVSSLDGQDVVVTGPNNFSQFATLVSVDAGTNGSPRTATYAITPPGGAWSPTANGTYTLTLQGGQALDVAGNAAAGGKLGTFIVNVATPAPDAPALAAATDSGVSDSDGVTNFNNASPAKALQFTVGNTTPGATVTVFADGVAIGSATATGATTTVTTDGTTVLTDGTHAITAQQQLPGAPPSASSDAVNITVDTAAPAVTIGGATTGPLAVDAMTFDFGEAVYGFGGGDVQLTRNGDAANNLLTGTLSLSPSGDGSLWTLSNLAPLTGDLGTYAVSLTLANVTDAAGNAAAATPAGASWGMSGLSVSGNTRLAVDADGVDLDVWQGAAGSPSQQLPLSQLALLPALAVSGSAGDDLLVLDFSNGNPLPAAGLSLDGAAGNDAIEILGTPGDDTVTAGAGGAIQLASATFGTVPIQVANVQTLRFPGGSGGTDALEVTGGTWHVDADISTGTPNVALKVGGGADVTFTANDQRLASLAIDGGTVRLPADGASFTLNVAGDLKLTNGGLLDLASGKLLSTAPIDVLRAYLATAYDGGKWDGGGGTGATGGAITSAYTATHAGHAIGYATAADGVAALASGQVLLEDALVGDSNLDGSVTFGDYQNLLGGFGTTGGATWAQGDTNYDGAITFGDYQTLLSNFGRTNNPTPSDPA